MQYRKFGKLDWKCSALGFGAMRLPTTDPDPTHINEAESIRLIRYAIDHGVNYIDSAYMYHGGYSEKLVAKALQNGYRQRVKVATKLPVIMLNSLQDADRILNEQLEKLQTPRIDFYLFHGLSSMNWSKVKELKLIPWAEKKIAAGLFNHLGFSFHDEFPVFKEIVDSYDNWILSQVQYNYLDVNKQAGIEGVRYAAAKGLAVVVMEPVRGGILSRKPPEKIASLWESAPSVRTLAEWALMWVWNHPEVSLALSGMTTIEQVIENVAIAERSGSGMMNSVELSLLDRVRETYKGLYPIPCTRCRYCMPCTNGVEIPGIFELYNEAISFDVIDMGRFRYNGPFGLKPEQKADKCIECGKCLEECPQKIAIPDWLKKIHKELYMAVPPAPPTPPKPQ
ncbi:MAG TPA: aldo/keto reductase [Dehalococcoidales bacterium]|nr:aldo/keto reductase [Dehalococcoidales bacterium]